MSIHTKITLYFRALELDCLKNSHPIEVPVGHPSEIDEIFDDISYNKGASVIRMLHKYIGDDDFRKGMNIYLTRHQVNILYLQVLYYRKRKGEDDPSYGEWASSRMEMCSSRRVTDFMANFEPTQRENL